MLLDRLSCSVAKVLLPSACQSQTSYLKITVIDIQLPSLIMHASRFVISNVTANIAFLMIPRVGLKGANTRVVNTRVTYPYQSGEL